MTGDEVGTHKGDPSGRSGAVGRTAGPWEGDRRPPVGAVVAPGTPTAVGSLPHADPVDAVELTLELLPELPAVPSLPRHHPAEGMIAQAARHIPGVTVSGDGSITVDPTRLGSGPAEVDLTTPGDAGLWTLMDMAAGRRGAVKVQTTGPVTLGMALVEAGADPAVAFDVALDAVRRRLVALCDVLDRTFPSVLAVVDEPSLVGMGQGWFPLAPDVAGDLVSGALAAVEDRAHTGVHCCGPTDYGALFSIGADVVSLPLDARIRMAAAPLAEMLERGGWIAWGVVPTDRPVGSTGEVLAKRLSTVWCDLVRRGCDPARLRTQVMVTPACGLATHGESQAARILSVTRDVAARLDGRSLAARFSLGA